MVVYIWVCISVAVGIWDSSTTFARDSLCFHEHAYHVLLHVVPFEPLAYAIETTQAGTLQSTYVLVVSEQTKARLPHDVCHTH